MKCKGCELEVRIPAASVTFTFDDTRFPFYFCAACESIADECMLQLLKAILTREDPAPT